MKTILVLFIILIAHCNSIGQSNRIHEVLIHSPSLEENMLGDPAKRYVSIYLPPSYNTNKTRKYPVVFFLHGNRNSVRPRNILALFGQPTALLMDSLIEEEIVKEMILCNLMGDTGMEVANTLTHPFQEIGQILS